MSDTDPNRTVLPVVAETLRVGTRSAVTGRVRVHLSTLTEDAPVQADLSDERVEVTRVPLDREVTERPEIRTEGDLTIIPVLEEVLVVERRLVLREEIHLRRVAVAERVETTVPLRRQQVTIERDGAGAPPEPQPTDEDHDDR